MAPEPTTDIKGKKALPKWAYFAIGGGTLVLVYLYKKKKEKEEEEKPVGQGAYTAQSFIPVTGENVAGVGAQAGGASGVSQNPENNTALLDAFLKNNEAISNYLIESGKNREKLEQTPQPISVNITGGGAPSSGQIGTGSGAASPPSGGSPGSKPGVPAAVNSCPASFPKYNPANGKPGPKSCYRISREGAKRKGYVIHGYQDGHEVESR